jgi:O-acetyl-ADP-ribose deacetylase (regulator of RNase III)
MDPPSNATGGRAVRVGPLWVEARAADLTTVDDVDAWIVPANPWLTANGTLAARVHALAGP